MTPLPRTAVVDVLACFEDEFADFAGGFCRGDYLLWLGSGISRDVVPSVPVVLARMLEFLRSNIDGSDISCRFRKALDEVLEVAGVSADTRAALDMTATVDSWAAADDIVGRLVDRYADVLSVQVAGEDEDFLVWVGLDVAGTYGATTLEPDVEHLCVAILMLEGVVRSAPTTNWDGLIEAAMQRLSGDVDRFLTVVVTAADFRETEHQSELVKFHGCAVRAAADEGEYRGRLIARKAQISGWTTRPENQLMKNRLEHLFATRSAFIVGLSAQDANIHTIWHQASQNLVRAWPSSPPAVVFAEQSLHHHHKHVLRVTYGDSYPANVDAVEESALLGAFAKPALAALVVFTLTEKLCALIAGSAGSLLPDPELEHLREGVRSLRRPLGELADANLRGFIDAVVSGVALALLAFRSGRVPDPGSITYQPISVAPVPTALANPDFPATKLGRFAMVVGLLGRGMSEGLWTLAMGTPGDPTGGVVRVTTARETARCFVVADARSLSQLEVDGVVDLGDAETIVVQAEAIQALNTRSPRPRYGRTGASGARYVDFEQLCATVSTSDELYEAFRLEGAL